MAYRFRVFSGTPVIESAATNTTPTATPTAGGAVDLLNKGVGLSHGGGNSDRINVFRMDCGGSFSEGAALATDGQGRAVAATTGDLQVARALESSSGAGDTAWCTWDKRGEAA